MPSTSDRDPLKRQRGLYGKFTVRRKDGRDMPGEKHEDCRYFVLDIDHDPHAIPALQAYADAARADGFERLADDLDSAIDQPIHAPEDDR